MRYIEEFKESVPVIETTEEAAAAPVGTVVGGLYSSTIATHARLVKVGDNDWHHVGGSEQHVSFPDSFARRRMDLTNTDFYRNRESFPVR